MGKRITIDPITRIEGHLKIDVEVENGKVKDAWSSGTMARGFEAVLLGRDPRDATYVTSRFCGVCFSVHQMASARALDAAFGASYDDFIWDLNLNKKVWSNQRNVLELFGTAHNLFDGSQYTNGDDRNPGRWVEAGLRVRF